MRLQQLWLATLCDWLCDLGLIVDLLIFNQ